MAGRFDFGAWSRHFKSQLSQFEQRQGEFDQALSSLALLVRDLPKPEKEPPIVMAKDPLTERSTAYCRRVDAALAKLDCRTAEIPPNARRLVWRRQCKRAIMEGNKEELEALLAWYYLWRELEKGNKEVESELGKFLGR